MSVTTYTCAGCRRSEVWTKADTYEFSTEEGRAVQSNFPSFQTCAYCEDVFCGDRCFKSHDCYGHEAEIVICMWCEAEIKIDTVSRPALIDGDPYCAKCAFEKPWEKKKEAQS